MGLQTTFIRSLGAPKRAIKVIWMLLSLYFRILLQFFKPQLRNMNYRNPNTQIAHPRYFNNRKDLSFTRILGNLKWVRDVSNMYQNDKLFDEAWNTYDYDSLVKAYFPTKLSPLEAVNIERSWKNSYFNPAHSDKANKVEIYRRSDALFADLICNAQGIYKIRKIDTKLDKKKEEKPDYLKKAKLFFGKILEQNRKYFDVGDKNVIDGLVEKNNLFYIDFPGLREIEKGRGQKKYTNKQHTTANTTHDVYIGIPFAIFAKIKNWAGSGKQEFICLASVFNDTFYKDKMTQKEMKQEVFHCFSEDIIGRDRWEAAKIFIAEADTNDFTFRIHLGTLHFASSNYTTALANLAKDDKTLAWMSQLFVDVFSSGLLQTNFLGNVTLVDPQDPVLEKIYYIQTPQAVNLMKDSNTKFNILEFSAYKFGQFCYDSDSVQMSKEYYDNLRSYVDYLFRIYQSTWDGRIEYIWSYIYKNLGNGDDRFDALPQKIKDEKDLKDLMTNLIFIWTVVHGQTFSLISVTNTFYINPPTVRKPVSYFYDRTTPMTDQQKQDFILPKEVLKDSMTLHKTVTFREQRESILSTWNQLPIISKTWRDGFEAGRVSDNFADYWNTSVLKFYGMNHQRTVDGLYNLHWFMPNQLPMSLNI